MRERQRNSLAAHLVHPRRVRNSGEGALKGQGTGDLVHLVLLIHLFRRDLPFQRNPRFIFNKGLLA